MTEITLIFPDQLFKNHPAIQSGREIVLAEEFLFYKFQPFHKQKLVLLRASMRAYAEKLRQSGKKVIYIPSRELNQRGDLFALLRKKQIKKIHLAEFADEWLYQDLITAAQKNHWTLSFYPSPSFICSHQEVREFFGEKKRYSMAQFYAAQRKKLDILMEDGTPLGGKYSFDVENRKKIPKGLEIPPAFIPQPPSDIDCLIEEVENEFPNAIGQPRPFIYSTTHEQARKALKLFLMNKLTSFGAYQDAIESTDSFLFHSVLSPLLNIGLLTPLEVVKTTLDHAKNYSTPINSLEGFLRQIIGWREYVRATYLLGGSRQRSSNFFHHFQKIPQSFWKGSVGILPIDTIIKRVLQTGYCNHIERLMVLGNFLLLTESSPHEVYQWFMGYFVDAYDWVMVPNVYGMSQYSDGGKIVTKPYVSASNYLLKMSNYPKGDWTEIWDGLFWRFLHIHKKVFASNPRTLTLIRLLEKNADDFFKKIRKAEVWLQDYRSKG